MLSTALKVPLFYTGTKNEMEELLKKRNDEDKENMNSRDEDDRKERD